jgi:hypothetical protein
LRAADKEDISYTDFVTRPVRAQWQAKREGALEWRIRRANLPERWTLETFPFAQPGVNRKKIRRTCSTKCMPRWRIDPRGSCSSGSRASTCSPSTR